MDKKPITAYILSLISFILIIAGFIIYWKDSEYTVSKVFLQTELAFFFVIPLFFVSLFLATRGSLKARLVWLGLLSYPLFKIYEKTSHLEGFNSLFFVASFSFALFAIILGIYNLDIKDVKLSLPTRASCIRIAVLLMFGFVIIAGMYFSTKYIYLNREIIRSIYPDHIRNFSVICIPHVFIIFSGHRIILGVLLPLFLLNTITILKRKMMGVILTPTVLTSGIVCLTSIISLNSIIPYCTNFKELVVFVLNYYNYPIYVLNIIIPILILLYLFFSSLFLVSYMVRIKELKS